MFYPHSERQSSQRSGAPVGPNGATSKSTGREGVANAVRSRGTAAIAKDSGPHNVRQIRVGDCRGLQGKVIWAFQLFHVQSRSRDMCKT